MLSFNNLTFSINQKNLFHNLNITFLPSAIIHLQGPNGCGKTSLLRIIANIQAPTHGEIFYNAIRCDALQKPYCNYIGHNLGLKLEMTVLENLRFWSKIYDSFETFEAALHYFNIYNLLDQKCYTLSSGNRKMVVLAKLMACQSNLWLLDEVEVNLSKENRALLHNLIILKANNGGIVIMSSHLDKEIQSAQILNLQEYKKCTTPNILS